MTNSQIETLTFKTIKEGVLDTFDAKDGSVILKSEKAIESIGICGGLTVHLHIFNNKFRPNGRWAKK